MDPINTALSGLHAAATKTAVSASNIANAQSTTSVKNGQPVNEPYVPQQVTQQAQASGKNSAGGGVSTSLRDVTPPSVPVFAPDSPVADKDGMVNLPNVNQTEEVANQLLASNAYKANLNVMKRADEMYKTMLDIDA